ncbi:fatty acid-binding adipocyte [Chrysochromulina tobinii]|uniref:Tpa: fatty acid-binding adipocyte n=1 Tax=Chrysochromulina tobinii TaxID=1460289 RepID=A0A0M0K8G5_9EUKA|nr:fatty acid-binding adipocyte [Chrysochromulina tobinii]|eukprot:KOO35146.1 fatty acid-binding adipocyte [Chrysochromulina sp. CCMP291]
MAERRADEIFYHPPPVRVRRTNTISSVETAQKALAFVGSWRQVSVTNLEGYLKHLGIPWAKRKLAGAFKPELSFAIIDGVLQVLMPSPIGERLELLPLHQEVIDVDPDGNDFIKTSCEPRAEYGDKYYSGATGPLPENVFEVVLPTPLGIQFEENDYPKKGVSVVGLVPDSNAAKSGLIAVGDYLVGVTAIQFQGAKWERRMLDCRKWDFDTVVDAIQSNKPQFSCDDVILQFYRAT